MSKGWKDVSEFAADIFLFLRNPCIKGPVVALPVLFFVVPMGLAYIISFPFFVLFPLVTIVLLRTINAKLVPPETPQSRGLLAAQIIASLQRFRYQLTSKVSGFVGNRLAKLFDYHGVSGFFSDFLFSWFFLLPSLFVLLLLLILFLIPFLTLLSLVSFIFSAVFGIVTTSTIHPGASHVPAFYAPATNSDHWSRMVVFASFGVIFGGLHCIGWTFKFPTHAEQNLWRATSLAITIIPLIVAPIDFLLAAHDVNSYPQAMRRILLVPDLVMTVLLFMYVPARLSLLAQALALLRNQPQSALIAVDWTEYVPHIFSS